MFRAVTEPSSPRYHGPIGKCIYCGSTDGPLSDEHAIPFALGGSQILRKASCEECREITRKIEEINLKGIKSNFGVFRVVAGFPTRKRKERPTHAPASIKTRLGTKRISMPIKDHPVLLAVPEFGEPGIFVGAPIGAPISIGIKLMKGDASETIKKYGGDITVDYYTKIEAFTRMLAKIAHCRAVITHGIDGFRPLLPDLIRGTRRELSTYLVGQSRHTPNLSAMSPKLKPNQSPGHLVSFHRSHDLIWAGVQLFVLGHGKYYSFLVVARLRGALSRSKYCSR
jgi:hypothetical protein